ncbi:MAG TPA: protein translocase subunit SecD [Candidatus Wildermuthbacteria bacterium]|nr:protein translocase subunit SecD [Candidatus Wildermuthbacteria bacterium]
MRKRNVVILLTLIVALAVVAAAFDYPSYTNKVIDSFNTQTESFSVIPVVSHIPETPFKLGLDLQGGIHLVYEADLSGIASFEYDESMEGLRDVIERRVNLFGVTEPLVQTEGSGDSRRLIVELAGISDPVLAIQMIGQTPFLDFRELTQEARDSQDDQTAEFTGNPFVVTKLTGKYLEKASIDFDNITQQPQILLQFDDEGSELFEKITARNIGLPLAIYLDGIPIQSPIVQSAISGGSAQITGVFSLEEARKVVRELNAGALPVPITLLSQLSVGPTLGAISLQESLRAGVIGLILIVVFLILFYRLPGLLASLALLMYMAFVLAFFKGIGATFTLAGIGGLVLSIGMAVDANILIFARLREELRDGRSFESAVEEGFRRAWPSIRDGNVTTLLVALILFWFGTSFVQGFALMLFIGVLLSMFSATIITKNLLRLCSTTTITRFTWLFK